MNRTLGVILCALGLMGLAWGGFTYAASVESGTTHVSRNRTPNVHLPAISGEAALIGGIVLLVAGKK